MKGKLSLLLPLVLVLAACGTKAAPAATPAASPTVAAQSGAATVTISNYSFSPASLTVSVGTTVKWTNQDDVIHTVEAADKSWGSQDLNQGDSFSYTFTQAGTFAYGCTQHPLMKGTIVVTP